LDNRISSIETRKVILSFGKMLGNDKALKESLRFEELYLQHKLECEAWLSLADTERLEKLKERF